MEKNGRDNAPSRGTKVRCAGNVVRYDREMVSSFLGCPRDASARKIAARQRHARLFVYVARRRHRYDVIPCS